MSELTRYRRTVTTYQATEFDLAGTRGLNVERYPVRTMVMWVDDTDQKIITDKELLEALENAYAHDSTQMAIDLANGTYKGWG